MELREASESGDYSQAYIYAGQAAGLVNDLLPAGQLVERLAAEAEERLGACQGLLSGEGS
jgi:nitronate monooxygenase